MKSSFRSAPVFYAVIALLLISAASCATRQPPVTTRVLVTGDADIKAQPDTAVIVLSVVTQNPRALDAQRENARKSEAVIQAIKSAAGAGAEVQTSDYSLQPQQSYRSDRMPSIIGYEARNTVTVTMSDLNNVGASIDAASGAGANSVETVSFVLRESNPARGETLAEATRQALGKAQAIAQALGGHVVRIVEEQEGGSMYRPPITEEEKAYTGTMNANTNAAKMSLRTPVEAGSLNVKSQVQMIVEIEARPQTGAH
jgi:uncharacterized protein YggE